MKYLGESEQKQLSGCVLEKPCQIHREILVSKEIDTHKRKRNKN